jgi:hypothetical protein
MPSDTSADVPVNYGPTVPKDDVATFVVWINAMEAASKYGREYVTSGNIDALRRMLSEVMVLKTLVTKRPLLRIQAKMVASIHPLDTDQRVAAQQLLKEDDG